MHFDDLLKYTYLFVLGACVEWNWQTKQFNDTNSREFMDFVARTHTVVFRYLRQQQTLDGSCSDLECALAHNARHAFGWHPAL